MHFREFYDYENKVTAYNWYDSFSICSNRFEMRSWLRIATALWSVLLKQVRRAQICTITIWTEYPIFWYEFIFHIYTFMSIIPFHFGIFFGSDACQTCYITRHLLFVSSDVQYWKDCGHFERAGLHHRGKRTMQSDRRCLEGMRLRRLSIQIIEIYWN